MRLSLFGLPVVGCGDDEEENNVPTTGAIEVVAVTTGEDLDADGYTVTLDGVDGPSVGANSSVTLPSLTAGTYSVGLDGIADNCAAANNPPNVSVVGGPTAPAQFGVKCEGPGANRRPVADAGQPQSLPEADNSGYESVTLDGSGSTDDGSIASWSWSLNGVEFGTGETLTVSADVGVYTVVVTVTDDEGDTDTDDVVITVVASGESMPPVANAGQNQSVEDTDDSGDEAVTLVGINSSDSDGTIVGWQWTKLGGIFGVAETVQPTFCAETSSVTLTVFDDDDLSDTDDVFIVVRPAKMEGVVVFEFDNYNLDLGEADLLRADIANLNDDIAGPCQPANTNWDHCISSMRVTEGWTAILFEDSGFEGDSLVVTENLADLDNPGGADWDNRASSIKMRPPN